MATPVFGENGQGFLGMEIQLTSLNRGFGVIFGLIGGYRSAHGTTVGLGIYDLLNGTPFPGQEAASDEPIRRTKLHFAGLIIEREFNGSREIRPGVSTLLGVGDVSAYYGQKKDSRDWSCYWIAEPGFQVHMADTRYRPGFGGGWRFHRGVHTAQTSSAMLSGPYLSGVANFHSF